MLRRVFRLLVVLSVIAVLAVAAVFIVSNTDFGRERTRRLIVGILQGSTHGYFRVESLHGNLLSGATMVNVSITDSSNHPFLKADSISLRYAVRSFFSQRLYFDDVTIYQPNVVVSRLPDKDWNYKILWPSSPTKAPADTAHGWGDWVTLTDVSVVNGTVSTRSPWAPKAGVSTRVRDSILKAALDTGARLEIVAVQGGYQKIIDLKNVNATAPLVKWADPSTRIKTFKVSKASMDALPFRPPPVVIRNVTGTFLVNDDSLWWHGADVKLPKTTMHGDGVYNLNSGDMTLVLASPAAGFGDFKWLYGRLPDEGGGPLDLIVKWRGSAQDYLVKNADLHVDQAHVAGDIGVSITDTIFYHDADLRFTGVTTKFIEKVDPFVKFPRNGVLSGRTKFGGTFKRLQLASTDITFNVFDRGISRFTLDGVLGFEGTEKVVVIANNLRVNVQPLQMDLVKILFPTVPVGGTLSGTTVLSGRGDTQLYARNLDIVHADGDNVSHAVGTAVFHTTGRQTMDLDLNAQPLALAEITKFAPTLPLKNLATGPLHAHGPIDALNVDTRLTLSGGGIFALRGVVDFLSKDLGYDVVADATRLDLSWVVLFGPRTALSGTARAAGRGFKPESMTSDFLVELSASSLDTLAIDSVSIKGTIANGLANIEHAHVAGGSASIDLNGQLGMDSLFTGTLHYSARLDSLQNFRRFIPGASLVDTSFTRPRPRAAFEALLRARADSAMLERQTELARAMAHAPGVKLRVPVDTPKAISRAEISGSVRAEGNLSGNLDHFSLDGTASATGLVLQGNAARHLNATYKLEDLPSKQMKVAAKVSADSVSAAGFAFDSLTLDGNYSAPSGAVSLRVIQGTQREYSLGGDFTVDTLRNELRLGNVGLRFDSTTWKTTHPSTVRFGRSGVEVVNLELTSGPGRRIYANGLLPTKGVANFELNVTDFAVENVAELLQSDLPVTGRLSLDAHVTGTAEDPRLNGKVDFVRGTYSTARVPDVHGTFDYANRQLVTKANAVDSTGLVLASLDGTIPIDLRLAGADSSRFPDLPINVAIKSDSLPLGLIPQFTAAVSDLKGRASANAVVKGTLTKPDITGELTIREVGVTIVATGAKLEHVNGDVRMTGDSIHVDSIAGIANGPVTLSGVVGIGAGKEPAFDLRFTAQDAQLLNNETGDIHADASLKLVGKLTEPSVSGAVTVLHGVLYIPESNGKKVIGAGDPALFSVVDTASKLGRDLFPAQSPLFKNLHADVEFNVERNTWVRSRDANVEIFTDGPMAVHVVGDALSLTGAVDADRGDYTFLSKQFQIKRGSALFIGTPDLNPTLQITAEYQVKQAAATATNIRVLIGGTLETPRISLESDAQPPLSQSDLLSYLAFGERSTSLLQFNSSSLAGGGQGNLISAAGSRLAGVALGVLLDDAKGPAARSLGADVFNITPGDLPLTQNQAGYDQFLKGTEVEAGKYINPQTFVSVLATPGVVSCFNGGGGVNSSCSYPGITFNRRTGRGYRIEANLSPRFIPNTPTLAGQTYQSTHQIGAFFIREWRF